MSITDKYIDILEKQDKKERSIFFGVPTEIEIMIAINKKIKELEERIIKLEAKKI